MNKLITKIIGVSLGLALATGVGVGVVMTNRDFKKVNAAGSSNWLTNEITSTSGLNTTDYYVIATNNSNSYVNGSTSSGHLSVTAFSASNPASTSAAGVIQLESIGTDTYAIKLVSTGSYIVSNLCASGSANVSASSYTYGWTFSYNSGWNAIYQKELDNKASNPTTTGYACLRSYNNGTIRTYKATNQTTPSSNGDTFKLFKYSESGGQVTYTVNYNGNGSTGGSVPVDSNSPYAENSTVTVLGNINSLEKTGYTFAGWNTSANGSGTSYTSGDTFTITGNVTLFAQWSYNTHYTDDTSANTITWDLTVPEYMSASSSAMSWESPKATMSAAKEGATTDTNSYCPPSNSSTRFYKDSTLTISPIASYKLLSIVAEATTEGYATALANSTWTNATASASTTTVTITPTSGMASVTATIGATTGLSQVVVYYGTAATLSSIAVSGSMTNTTYSVGANWNPAGLIVTATYSDSSSTDVTSRVSWTYNPATATSTSVTSVVATASYEENDVTKTAESAPQSVTVVNMSVDIITVDKTDAEGTSYVTTTGIAGESAVYASNNAKASAENGGGLQYRSSNNNSGLVSTTSGGLIKKVTITYPEGKSGQFNIYGKNTAYTSPSDLYSESSQGTLLGSISTSGDLNVTDDYQYVGIRSSSGARYITSISLTWEAVDPTAPTISIDQAGSEQVIGATGTLTATVTNAGANTVSWSSSDPTVISINSSTGAWTANKIGASTITATLGSTGKKSTIAMTVTGEVTVAEARTLIDGLGGSDSLYKVTVIGYVTGASGDGTKSKSNSIYIADVTSGTDTLQIFFGYNAVSNWSTVSVTDARIKAKGILLKYNTTYELKEPTNVETVDTDTAAVQDFVATYMHMTDYTSNSGYCNDSEHHYYLTAKAGFNALTSTQQNIFKTESEFAAAKARYEAWAVANNDAAPYDGNDTVVTTLHSNISMFGLSNDTNGQIAITVIVVMVTITAVGGYFLLRKKKEER